MQKQTQSFKLHKLFQGGKVVTSAKIAKTLKVDRSSISGYVAELIRVYGASIKHTPRSQEWKLTNKIVVPVKGHAGKNIGKSTNRKRHR